MNGEVYGDWTWTESKARAWLNIQRSWPPIPRATMESWTNLPRSVQQELGNYDPDLCWKPLEWEQRDRQPWNTHDSWSRMNAMQPPGALFVGEKLLKNLLV